MSEKATATIKTTEIKKVHSRSQSQRPGRHETAPSPIDHILNLHKTVGNQAVQRLFKAGVLQAKLRIGQPNDIYEQEADRVADQVMRMPIITVVSDRSLVVGENKESTIQLKPG